MIDHRTDELAVITTRDEPRIDSRLLARHLGNRHRHVVELIDRYAEQFRRINHLRFQTAVGERKQGGGNAERYALLTEDQAFFLLSLSRNTERVVDLKARLVQAFREARKAAELRHAEYLPTYHALHDGIKRLAAGSPNERFVHLNVNRLLNKVAGIGPGQRRKAGLPAQSLLAVGQAVATTAMHGAADHRDGYARASGALQELRRAALLDDGRGAARIGGAAHG